jgi:ectoine hydroxylase-related dioxygenase (phytanoyl-CoA dioxygenase family)
MAPLAALADLPPLDRSAIDFDSDALDVDRAAGALDEAGFIVVRGLMRRYVEPMMAEVAEAVRSAHLELPSATAMRYGLSTASGAIFSDRDPSGRPRRMQLICAPLTTASSPTMRACASDARLLEILGPLLGSDVEAIGTGQCMYKEALDGFEASLHQDVIYPGAEGHRDVIYSFTYLVPTSIERGCIWLVPYSHRLGRLDHEESGPREGAIPLETCDFSHAVPFPGEAGDTILWKYTIVHGSKGNLTDVPRPAVITRYGRPRSKTSER